MKNQKIIQQLADIADQIDGCHLSEDASVLISSHLQSVLDLMNVPAPDQPIEIWSDGACSGNPGPGGWGTIIKNGDNIVEISGNARRTTNNIMELTGALEGIKRTPAGSTLIVTSDSQYLVKGMNEWIAGWKRKGWKKSDGKPVLNKEIWISLDQEASTRTIKWEWVKGHEGHLQNERCDELARRAIQTL